MIMIVITFVTLLLAKCLTSAQTTSGLQALFPAKNQYVYEIKTNISTGTLLPEEAGSYWTLEGRLTVQVFDNYTRARIRLADLKTSINNGDREYAIKMDEGQNGPSPNKVFDVASRHLTQPWEVDYQEDGNIHDLYVTPHEPLWATNIKRAVSINFQLKRGLGTYHNIETCLYDSYMDCRDVVYVSDAQTVHKYNALHILSESSGFSSWMSAPMHFSQGYYVGPRPAYSDAPDYSGPLDNIGTADRTYKLDDKIGLKSLHLRSVFQHRTGSNILAVITELSLSLTRTEVPKEETEKLILVKTGKRYDTRDFSNPTNGIREYSQAELRAKTYELLLKIVGKGIDVDYVRSNPSKIHSLDLVELLKTLAQLDYASLHALYSDIVLGTSYEIETSKNVFLEVLPHVRTHASAFFVKTLVVELKRTVEEPTLLSIIRKLPFNVANHSQELLDGLEVFTRLGPDFSPDLRHAGILSFATLLCKAAEARRVTRDYLDTVVVKYFRMYSDCPDDRDKLVWLQGLSNIHYSTGTYMMTIFNNASYGTHERFWAILASTVSASTGYPATWHIIMNDNEHIQLRIAALHSFLCTKTRPSELLSIQNYIAKCGNAQLKRFWCTTVSSLEKSQSFNDYRIASNYIQFLKNQVQPPRSDNYLMTGNHIVGDFDEVTSTGAMMQLLMIGDPVNGAPSLLHFRVKTVNEVMTTGDVALFLKLEGLQTFVHRSLARLLSLNSKEVRFETIIELLKKMDVKIQTPEKVHIEVVLKIHDKTVYASRGSFNQTEFDVWSKEKLTKAVQEVLNIGSHVNQQVVYYPFQLDASIPTELGTPIRLQTTTVSYSSIRGNLTGNVTALFSEGFGWRNDMFVDYQATAVTSLATDSPLLKSENAAIVQHSMVAHLPFKFDFTIGLKPLRFDIKFINTEVFPGLAIHSRTLNAVEYFTASGNSSSSHVLVKSGDEGLERQNACTTLQDLWQKVENGDQKSVLDLIDPSLLLRPLLLLSSPPPLPVCAAPAPRFAPSVARWRVTLKEPVSFHGEVGISVASRLEISPPTQDGGSSVGYNVSSDVVLQIVWNGEDSKTTVINRPHTTLGDDEIRIELDRKRLNDSYTEGTLHVTCTREGRFNTSHLLFNYELQPRRSLQVTGTYNRYPPDSLALHQETGNESILLDNELSDITQFKLQIKKLSDAVRVDTSFDGIQTSHTLNGNLGFLLQDWSYMDFMRRLGVYYECRYTGPPRHSDSYVKFGNYDVLIQQKQERLVLADCTAAPRFAITVTREGKLKIYSGNHVLIPSDTLHGITKTASKEGNALRRGQTWYYPGQNMADWEFKVTIIKGGWSIDLWSSGVELLLRGNDVTIYTPSTLMATSCGYCRG